MQDFYTLNQIFQKKLRIPLTYITVYTIVTVLTVQFLVTEKEARGTS